MSPGIPPTVWELVAVLVLILAGYAIWMIVAERGDDDDA